MKPKQILTILSALLISMAAHAYSFEADGIYYNIISYGYDPVMVEVTDVESGTDNGNYYYGEINIPENFYYEGVVYRVTRISDNAFAYCTALTSVTIPNSVEIIGDQAFYGCTALTSVTIPRSVRSIGLNPFTNCSSLTSIVVDRDNSFYDSRDNCNAIITTEYNYLIAGCRNTRIPSSVTSIGTVAFAGCSGLSSITIPSSVTSIGENAFSGCSLTSVTLPSSITSIPNYSFSYCYNLTSVIIPEGVTSIGNDAFYGCQRLTSVTLPSSITSIGKEAFYQCDNLTDVYCRAEQVPSTSGSTFTSRSYNTTLHVPSSALSDYSSTSPWSGFNSIIALGGDGLDDWESSNLDNGDSHTYDFNAEEGDKLSFDWYTENEEGWLNGHLTITLDGTLIVSSYSPSSDTYETILTAGFHTLIASYSKNGYSSNSSNDNVGVRNISITRVGKIDFADPAVKALCIANWDTNHDGKLSESEATSVADLGTVFKGNTEITSFDELQYFTGLTSIGKEAFYGCSGLTSVDIPESVTSIGNHAFFSCKNLTSATIPEGVTSIGDYAFFSCKNLTSATIPSSVTSIGYHAFEDCSGLTSVTIPEGVTSIGKNPFLGCYNLNTIVVDSGNNNYDSRENCNAIIETATNTLISGCKNTEIPNSVTSIGNHAFFSCKNLTSATIPSSVTKIGNQAFSYCSGLTSVTIPESVTSIGGYAFENCFNLTSVTIPNSVTSISYGAFYGCSSLTSVTIPSSVTSIGEYAFSRCSGLPSVTIPENVTSIGEGSFYGCNNLTEIHWTPNANTNLSSSLASANLTSTSRTLYLHKKMDNIAMVDQLVSSLDGQFREIIVIDNIEIVDSDERMPVPQTIGFNIVAGTNSTDTLYLYNVGAKMYLTEGNDWGTRASSGITGLKVFFEQYIEDPENPNWDGSTYLIWDYSLAKGQWRNLFIDSETAMYVDHGSQGENCWHFQIQNNGSTFRIFAADDSKYNHSSYPGSYVGIVEDLDGNIAKIISPLLNPDEIDATREKAYHIDWAFVTKEAYERQQELIPEYLVAVELKAKIEEISEKAPDLDISAEKIVYNTINSTVDELQAALESLIEKYNNYLGVKASPSNPISMDDIVGNTTFDENHDGWTSTTGCQNNLIATGQCSVAGPDGNFYFTTRFWENWDPRTFNGKMYTQVAQMPAGVYRLELAAFANGGSGSYVYMNNDSVEVTTGGKPYKYEVISIINTDTIEIGLKEVAGISNWIGVDNCHLTYYGNSTASYAYLMAETVRTHVIPDRAYYQAEDKEAYDAVVAATANPTSIEDAIAKLQQLQEAWDTFYATLVFDYFIDFADANVKALCIANWDTNLDGELDKAEAAAVTSLGEVFKGNTEITSFDELQYFTGLTDSPLPVHFALSTWKTSAKYDNIVITSDGTTLYQNDFSIESLADWTSGGGQWQVENGALCQTDTGMEGNLFTLSALTLGNNYTIDLDATKVEGDEGFLIGFNVADEGDRCWWNIGGWSNTKTQLEERISYVNNPVGNESSQTVENGRTYHITIAVNNDNVKCYLDGEQIHDYNFTVLERILHHAFEGCSNLSSITIPNTVTSIGERAFYGCSSLPSITIPNTITSIGLSAFENCWGLANIDIPNSVTSIGAWVFKGCAGLTSVNIPNSITSISEQAFYDCSALTNIEIPNSVTSIGQYAFHGCSSLTELVIPSSVSSIGWGAFEQTPQLASIVVDDANTTFDSRDNCNAIIETATNTLVAGCKNTVIPNTITTIGGAAFTGCTGLNSLIIPESVTSLEGWAFNGCSGLTTVILPESVTSIGDWAFADCYGLTSVTIPESVTSIGDAAFWGCWGLTEIHWTPNADTNLSSSLSSANLTSTDRTLYLYKNAENAAMVDQLVISLDGQFKEIIVIFIELTAYLAEDGSGDYYCTYYNADDSYVVGDNLAVAYTATVSGSTVTLTPIEGGVILAGTPVVLRSTQETIPLNYAGSDATATYGQNDLIGTSVPLTVSKSDNIYGMKNGTFYLAAGGTIPANRAYLQLNASAGAPSRLDMVIGEATALQRVQDETEAEVWYTLSGVRVERPTKAGIYIKNGKKVLVK